MISHLVLTGKGAKIRLRVQILILHTDKRQTILNVSRPCEMHKYCVLHK